MDIEPLEYLPVERWSDALEAFKTDFPRGISAYYTLETQLSWMQQGLDYGFKVYCPFGDVWNGIICFNQKNEFNEIIIQCPTKNTDKLEDALRSTKLIAWNKRIMLPFTSEDVINCVKRVLPEDVVQINLITPCECFVIDDQRPLFVDASLPPDMVFEHLSIDYLSLVNSKWPYRHRNSEWYFRTLINAKCGFGLFKDKELVAWVFITEVGTIGHLYTIENHRKKGYAMLTLKLISNVRLKEKKHIFGYCVDGNTIACNMYNKLGFESLYKVAWYGLRSNNK